MLGTLCLGLLLWWIARLANVVRGCPLLLLLLLCFIPILALQKRCEQLDVVVTCLDVQIGSVCLRLADLRMPRNDSCCKHLHGSLFRFQLTSRPSTDCWFAQPSMEGRAQKKTGPHLRQQHHKRASTASKIQHNVNLTPTCSSERISSI